MKKHQNKNKICNQLLSTRFSTAFFLSLLWTFNKDISIKRIFVHFLTPLLIEIRANYGLLTVNESINGKFRINDDEEEKSINGTFCGAFCASKLNCNRIFFVHQCTLKCLYIRFCMKSGKTGNQIDV